MAGVGAAAEEGGRVLLGGEVDAGDVPLRSPVPAGCVLEGGAVVVDDLLVVEPELAAPCRVDAGLLVRVAEAVVPHAADSAETTPSNQNTLVGIRISFLCPSRDKPFPRTALTSPGDTNRAARAFTDL